MVDPTTNIRSRWCGKTGTKKQVRNVLTIRNRTIQGSSKRWRTCFKNTKFTNVQSFAHFPGYFSARFDEQQTSSALSLHTPRPFQKQILELQSTTKYIFKTQGDKNMQGKDYQPQASVPIVSSPILPGNPQCSSQFFRSISNSYVI